MNIIIVILLVWLIVFLHLVWLDVKPRDLIRGFGRKTGKEVREKPVQQPAENGNFMGKSLVRGNATKPVADISLPVAAIPEEGEEVDEKDVTFAPPRQEKGIRQMTPEEEEEAFKSFTFSKEDDAGEQPADGYAEGYTYEDMVEAVKVANSKTATTHEEEKAGRVLKDLDGTELLSIMEEEHEDFSRRVRSLIKKHEDTESMTVTKENDGSTGSKPFTVPANPTEFNIRDFI